MANILDYLEWRGDIPFSVSPFNEVDNLVFCEMVFIDLNGILPPYMADGHMLLCDAVERYFEKHPSDQESLGVIVPNEIRVLLRRMAKSKRYGQLMLSNYVDHVDENVQKQFAAVTVHLNESEAYLAFRGTDDTLVGWKENFNMSFMEAIPAQLDAVQYLNDVAEELPFLNFYIGGHSKGGNLAIYSSIYCSETVKPRILRVYSNDGPGYRPEVVNSSQYKEMKPRIQNIIPQTSVIGRLLEHDEHYTVIHSSASGLWQHDGFSWEVTATGFVPAPALSQESEMIDKSIKKWIDEMQPQQRQAFVDALYKILTATNAKTLTELTKDRNWLWKLMTVSDPQDRKTVMGALGQLTGEAGRQWVENLLPNLLKGKKPVDGQENGAPPPKELPVKTATGTVKDTAKSTKGKSTTPGNVIAKVKQLTQGKPAPSKTHPSSDKPKTK